MIASAVLYTIAIRARAGESRAALKGIAETAIKLICENFRDNLRDNARAAAVARPAKRHT